MTLKHDDYSKILDYIEVPEHFDAIHRSRRKTSIGAKYQNKKTTFASMVVALAQHEFPAMDGANLGKQ